jgi:hypothetical protein
MVVMVRSLGIPARFATGFLAQTPDANGVQHIFAINAHSWAEVYFADYGWIEFEPTAAFPSQSRLGNLPEFLTEPPDFPAGEFADLPPPPETGNRSILTNPNFLLVLFLFIAGVGFLFWLAVGRQTEPDSVLRAYGRLQRSANRIGQPTPESQTPNEFEKTFSHRISSLAQKSKTANWFINPRPDRAKTAKPLQEEAQRLTELFMTYQYQKRDEAEEADTIQTAEFIWQRIRFRLWVLAILNKVGRFSQR